MSKQLKTSKVDDWQIVDAEHAGVLAHDPNHRFLIGTFEGYPIRTSYIVHNGAPNYVETANSVYPLGTPHADEKPLTPIQNQAVAVVKKSIVETIAGSAPLEPFSKALLEDSAQTTAHIVIHALAKAHLLVQ